MTDEPLISCVIPVYNHELYIGETIESVLTQTHRPLEVIVVDDGSTDGTAAVIARFGDRVRYVYQTNAGPAAARNKGAELANGAYLAWLDSDDLWREDKLERQLAFLRARPDVDICLTYLQNFWIDDLADEAARLKDSPRSRPLPGYVFAAVLMSREAYGRIGPSNAAIYHGDGTDWMMRAMDSGAKIEVLPEVMVWRRYHHTNISRVDSSGDAETFLILLKRHLDQKRGKVSRS